MRDVFTNPIFIGLSKPHNVLSAQQIGGILNEAIKAQQILEKEYAVSADIWSVTSYKELYSDAVECERWNLLHPEKKPKQPYLSSLLEKEQGSFVAASDYMKVLPASVATWREHGDKTSSCTTVFLTQ